MFTTIDETIIQELKEILALDSGEEVEYYQQFNNLYFSTSVNELMVRLIKPYNRIVIARVVFNNKQKGHLTKTIETLSKVDWATTIEMEAVITPEGQAYCSEARGFYEEEHKPLCFVKQVKKAVSK